MFWTLYFSLAYALPGGKEDNNMPHLFEYTFQGLVFDPVVERYYLDETSFFRQRIYDHNLWMHFRFRVDTWLWTANHNIRFTFTHLPLLSLYEVSVVYNQPGEPTCQNDFYFNYPKWGWNKIATEDFSGENDYTEIAFTGDEETSYYIEDEQDPNYQYVYFRMRGFPSLFVPYPSHILGKTGSAMNQPPVLSV